MICDNLPASRATQLLPYGTSWLYGCMRDSATGRVRAYGKPRKTQERHDELVAERFIKAKKAVVTATRWHMPVLDQHCQHAHMG